MLVKFSRRRMANPEWGPVGVVAHQASSRRWGHQHLLDYWTIYRNKKYHGKPDPGIKSWAQPVGALKDLLKIYATWKGALVLFPHRWIYGLKEFFSCGSHKGWKYYLGVIYNTYHGGNIEMITLSYARCQKTWQSTLRSLISPPQCQVRWGKFLKIKLQQEITLPSVV